LEKTKPPYNFKAGSILLVDKPLKWTSFDVVNKIRYALKHKLGVKKIKVGHAGTLDPLATGLLIICTGKFTKKIESIQVKYKAYSGSFLLGKTTQSYDAEFEPDQTFPTEHITNEIIENARQKFLGDIDQFPPHFSAIKIDGQRLYKSARKGIRKEIKSRPVSITKFDLTKIETPNIEFYVECSKGTYIRSLAHDFGKACDSGAYLTSLRRTGIGEFSIKDAWNLEALIEHINKQEIISSED